MPFALIIVVLIILFLALLFSFVPIGLLISASASGVKRGSKASARSASFCTTVLVPRQSLQR